MMYTAATSYVGYEPISPNWTGVLSAHGAIPDVSTILSSYDKWCKRYNISPNIALAQACQEEAYFTGERWTQEWNPAGLGITSSDTPPSPFASPDQGIQAHVQHVCCYVYSSDGCPVENKGDQIVDRRHSFHDGLPQISTLERPGTRQWAVPGDTYIQAIIDIANAVVGVNSMATATWVDGTEVPVPTSDDIGFPVRIDWAADYEVTSGRTIQSLQWFTVHDAEGTEPGVEQILVSAAPPVESAHAVIDRDGSLCFMVPLHVTAWHPGNDAFARVSIGVEQEGFASGQYTPQQYQSMAAFFNWCVKMGAPIPAVYIGKKDADGGPLPDVPGILGHQDVPDGAGGWGGSSHHTDPGPNYDWSQLLTDIKGTSPAPTNPDVLTIVRPDGVKIDVAYGFLHNVYEKVPDAERLKFFGWPKSGDVAVRVIDSDGSQWMGRGQFWERGKPFLHDPRNPPGDWQDYIAMADQMVEEVAQ